VSEPNEITPQMIVFCACAIHDSVRATQIANSKEPYCPWINMPMETQMQAVELVENMLANYRLSASEFHEKTRDDLVADGWIYHEEFSMKRKTSPLLLPWDRLPAAEQDQIFVSHSVVHAVFHRFISPALSNGKPFRMCGEEVK
jgi:hypothetical protein